MFEPVLEAIPLRKDAHGVLRVGGTRVPLETVVHAFETGATPEEIVQRFSVLRLDDVYAVITYYLRHQEEVAAYLRQQDAKAEDTRRRIETEFPRDDLRRRLLARHTQPREQ